MQTLSTRCDLDAMCAVDASASTIDDYDDDLDPEDDLDLDDLDYGDNREWFEGFAQGYAAGLYHNSLRARLGRARWRFLKRMPHKIRWCFWHIVYRLFPDDSRIPF